MLNLKNKNLVVLNTPSNFDLSIFDKIKATEKYNKLIFLIHQINHFTNSAGVFKVNKKAYYQCLGLSSFQLNNLLNLLIDAGLIEHMYTGNSFTKRLSEYKFIDPFQPETGIKHQYDAGDKKCPEFIKKIVADNWRVLPTAKSAYVRERSSTAKTSSKTVVSLQSTIDEQAQTIELLKAELASSRNLISTGEILSAPETEDVTEPENSESSVHVALQHEFEYYNNKYVVDGWNLILGGLKEPEFKDYLEEEIADACESKSEELFSTTTKIIKRYDFNEKIYNVQVVAG